MLYFLDTTLAVINPQMGWMMSATVNQSDIYKWPRYIWELHFEIN